MAIHLRRALCRFAASDPHRTITIKDEIEINYQLNLSCRIAITIRATNVTQCYSSVTQVKGLISNVRPPYLKIDCKFKAGSFYNPRTNYRRP